MILKDLGEFNFIKRISALTSVSKCVIKGIGDDAAVLKGAGGRYTLFTSDMLVEGRHFKRNAGGYLIGKKSLSASVSDIAAMGGWPGACVVSLGAPPSLDVKFVDGIYKGLRAVSRKYKIDLVGGDTVASEKIIINVALLGEVEKDNLTLRGGAKTGDAIFVTGSIGGSLAGSHLDFSPRLEEARSLVNNFKVNSMIDVSDGLLADLGHILEASGKGAVLYEKNVPVSKKAKDFNSAVTDGEDFELVFTLPEKDAGRLERAWRFKTNLSRIGCISAKGRELIIIDKSGAKKKIKPRGYKHF
ncbi:MAG: thiamine-phosphate kinase [Candidatus Omnitrophica bacterium]|nr:thiamine-phosphate kinase [Candidatus Omnitrophota bacterium]